MTGQHRAMLQQVLQLFELSPGYDLNVIAPNQTLNCLVCRIMCTSDPVLDAVRPTWCWCMVNTSTRVAAGLAAVHRRIAVAHVEAGLRTHDLARPWPDKMNRRAMDSMADYLFTPTQSAKQNLLCFKLFPVHLNPSAQTPVTGRFAGSKGVHLIPPQDYLPFAWLMQRAHIILPDSGAVQEEAPTLGKPVLVMRDVTETPEAIRAGTVKLVGANAERIVSGVEELLASEDLYGSFARASNPYEDGHARRGSCTHSRVRSTEN